MTVLGATLTVAQLLRSPIYSVSMDPSTITLRSEARNAEVTHVTKNNGGNTNNNDNAEPIISWMQKIATPLAL